MEIMQKYGGKGLWSVKSKATFPSNLENFWKKTNSTHKTYKCDPSLSRCFCWFLWKKRDISNLLIFHPTFESNWASKCVILMIATMSTQLKLYAIFQEFYMIPIDAFLSLSKTYCNLFRLKFYSFFYSFNMIFSFTFYLTLAFEISRLK